MSTKKVKAKPSKERSFFEKWEAIIKKQYQDRRLTAMGEKSCQVTKCRNRCHYTVTILMGERTEMTPAIEVRLCSKHMDEFQHKPRPDVKP